jgi:hypothetical protein
MKPGTAGARTLRLLQDDPLLRRIRQAPALLRIVLYGVVAALIAFAMLFAAGFVLVIIRALVSRFEDGWVLAVTATAIAFVLYVHHARHRRGHRDGRSPSEPAPALDRGR